jgi:hypothetical protein
MQKDRNAEGSEVTDLSVNLAAWKLVLFAEAALNSASQHNHHAALENRP